MTEKRFKLGYVCGDYGLIDNEKDTWTDFHSMSENSEKNVQICIWKLNEQHKQIQSYRIETGQLILDFEELKQENEQLKSDYDTLKIQDDARKQYQKELMEENEQLKQQLYYDGDSVCNICKHQYLVETEKYYVAKCEKEHEKCSKEDIKYCEDFKVKGDYECLKTNDLK